ncbi:MAG: coenzyme F420-0:L-glutamate ligase [Candidatus Levybacteria bacterium]|nr:coenzyme F420-0:L-glutamate ligase [Candidatus Levybacteria bacterium]
MKVTSVKTHKITQKDKDILKIVDRYIKKTPERSIIAVTSKIISICEGRMVRIGSKTKDELVKKEAEFYLPRHMSKYDFSISIKRGIFTASAGIDESNGNGYYILWPKDPQRSANKIREYFLKKFKIKNLGVIVTDSKTTPLRWGVTGVAIAHSGFSALNSYIGKPDIFGRKLQAEKLNVADSLASSAVGVMGEGDEQTPLAIIEDVPFVNFQSRNPTEKELEELKISIEDDLYAPLIKAVSWEKGDY